MTEQQANIIKALKTVQPSALILLADDSNLQKALITWEIPFSHLEDAVEFDTLQECWDQTRVDFRNWSYKCGLSIHELRRCFNVLRLNNLIYPDGTAHPNALLYVHSVATIKIKEIERKTTVLRAEAETRKREAEERNSKMFDEPERN